MPIGIFIFLNNALFLTIIFALISRKKEGEIQNPFVNNLPVFSNSISNPISEITANTAKFSTIITFDGGLPIIARGVVWNTNSNPTIDSGDKS